MADWLRKNADYLGHGYIKARLYDIGGYPGAVQSVFKQDSVLGDVYRLTAGDFQLQTLDEYEECSARFSKPHEYLRKISQVQLADGNNIMAWVYWYQLSAVNLPFIASGDYLSYLDHKGSLLAER